MPPKTKKDSPTERNSSDPSSNLIDNDETEQAPEQTEIGIFASEVHELDRADDIVLQQRIDVDDLLSKVCCEFEIRPRLIELLRKLRDFNTTIVCDDSGSMQTPIRDTQRTRWDKLCEFVKRLLKFCVIFNPDGIDIYFLNRRKYPKVKDPAVVDQIFQTLPMGYTPLVPVLKEIFESEMAGDKKLLVFVATDGGPTDKDANLNVHELERLMRETRQTNTTHVSFLICTDNQASVAYLNEWDKIMVNVDVIDDFHIERDKIRQRSNCDFTLGDYLVKLLVGAIVPDIHRFIEKD